MIKSFMLVITLMQGLCLFAQGQTYTVQALKFGERRNYVHFNKEVIGDTSKDSTRVVFMYWLLSHPDRKVLVDAGFTGEAGIDSSRITYTRPDLILQELGIEASAISDIIITHPHWDHVGGISLYPSARVWMQKKDYEELLLQETNPEAKGFNPLDIQRLKLLNREGKLKLINGKNGEEILPGLKVYSGSQHTPGSQYVLVNNGHQQLIIASDNCKYYRHLLQMASSPATSSQKAYRHELRNMKKLVKDKDLILPGHDPLVFTKFTASSKNSVLIKK